jgi:hypothetical protein
MLRITFPDAPDILVSAELDGKIYYIRLLYNAEGAYWTLSIRDKDNLPLAEGVKAVSGYPFFRNRRGPGLPPGEFMVICRKDVVGRADFKTGAAKLLYINKE